MPQVLKDISPYFPPFRKALKIRSTISSLPPTRSQSQSQQKGAFFLQFGNGGGGGFVLFFTALSRERERETTRGHPYMTSHIFLIFNPLHPLSVFKIFTVFSRIWCFYCPTSLLRCGHRIWKAEAPLRVFNAEKRRRIRSF